MITSAKIEDATALTLLINSAYRGESSKKGWTTEATILEGSRTHETEILEIIKDSNQTLLKFTDDKTILGCVLLIEKESKLYLGMLTVSPELQNSGIGKKLLAVAEDHANQIGLKRIVMTVISIRKELIEWYKRHGYQDTGEREAFPVSDIHIPIVEEQLEFMVLEKRL